MFKKEKGITLVALVVTIVILLILAGVTISMTLSGNGLFNRAQSASNTYKKSEHNESVALEGYENAMNELFNKIDQ